MKKNLKIAAALGVVAVVAVGGTFAYYTAQQTFENPFSTTDYSTSAVEKFNPAESNKWEPGATVDKKVTAKNTGEGDVWVRVKFDEAWTRKDASLAFTGNEGAKGQWTSKGGLEDGCFNVPKGEASKKPVAGKHQADPVDGLVAEDTGTVVFKNLVHYSAVPTDQYEKNKNSWYYNKNDGYFYYRKTLASGETTDTLLDGVTLCSDTDMGSYIDSVYYYLHKDETPDKDEDDVTPAFDLSNAIENPTDDQILAEDKWIKGELPVETLRIATGSDAASNGYEDYDVFTYKDHQLNQDALGYANADYVLNITVEFIQTTEQGEELANDTWLWTPNELIHD